MSEKLSVIAFSKDRPMQLHAYIESLLRFSDLKEHELAVIYVDSEKIPYDKVMKSFPAVRWIREKNFYDDLMRALDDCNDCFMFGCDDVVFKDYFSVNDAKKFLQANDDVFGFSFRLGRNIKLPQDYDVHDSFLVWDWRTADTVHYNYPWELDCTLYRKDDAKNIITLGKRRAFAPNPLEGIVTMNPEGYITRPNLSCYDTDSKAIVITVNRVQDIAKNSFDARNLITDPEYLGWLYNSEDVRLNIEAIAKLKNSQVHVGLEYLVLTNGFRGKPRSIWSKIFSRRFIPYVEKKTYNAMKKVYRALRYRVKFIRGKLLWLLEDKSKFPVILSDQESLEYLKKNLMSFCRFGDGELICALGGGYTFSES